MADGIHNVVISCTGNSARSDDSAGEVCPISLTSCRPAIGWENCPRINRHFRIERETRVAASGIIPGAFLSAGTWACTAPLRRGLSAIGFFPNGPGGPPCDGPPARIACGGSRRAAVSRPFALPHRWKPREPLMRQPGLVNKVKSVSVPLASGPTPKVCGFPDMEPPDLHRMAAGNTPPVALLSKTFGPPGGDGADDSRTEPPSMTIWSVVIKRFSTQVPSTSRVSPICALSTSFCSVLPSSSHSTSWVCGSAFA